MVMVTKLLSEQKGEGDGYGAAVNTGTGNVKELRNIIRAAIHVQN
jgi:hypothetical protein